MTDNQLYARISSLPDNLKKEVFDFVNLLICKANKNKRFENRIPGKAKGLIRIENNFDAPIPGFEKYTE